MSHAKGAAATRAGRAVGAGGLQQATLLVTAEATKAAALAAKASRANAIALLKGFAVGCCSAALLAAGVLPVAPVVFWVWGCGRSNGL